MKRLPVIVFACLLAVSGAEGERRSPTQLPEVVVESPRHRILHILAYVRECSTLSTCTDTVFLFREKMVDYMLPSKGVSFKGWSRPRILKSRSFYRFTDAGGLDSVSDNCNHHFSWSDWMGIAPSAELPSCLRDVECGMDTVRGKYSPSETWTRNEGRVAVDVNVLADREARRWVPGLSAFFGSGLDFESFRVRFSYDNVVKNSVSPVDLAGYSFDVESNGRGHKMFRFSRIDEPFSVSTHADVYIMDREYITVKEAKKWERHDFNADEIEMLEPVEAPDLPPSIQTLVDRIYKIDPEEIRLGLEPDRRLVGTNSGSRNFRIGNRALFLLKQITGITLIKSRRNFNRRWDEFRKQCLRGNK